MKKKILLASVVLLLSSGISHGEQVFNDVTGNDYFGDSISYVAQEKIVNGYSDGSYKTNNSINRAEFTKILINALFKTSEIDSCIGKSGKPFPDVPQDSWFAKYVCVAKANKIINGYPDGNFVPANDISFVEAAKVLSLSFGKVDSGSLVSTSVWYKPYVEALDKGNVTPTTVDDFGKKITRGETAEFIYRIKKNIANKPSTNYGDLGSSDGDVTIKEKQLYNRNIEIKKGDLVLSNESTVKGNIIIVKGNLTIGDNSQVDGNIRIVKGSIKIGSNIVINGNVVLEEGRFVKSNSGNNSISIKGNVYSKGGNLLINDSYNISGDVLVEKGDLLIGNNVVFSGNITLNKGNLTVGDYSQFNGNVDLKGNISLGNNNNFKKKLSVTSGVLKQGSNNILTLNGNLSSSGSSSQTGTSSSSGSSSTGSSTSTGSTTTGSISTSTGLISTGTNLTSSGESLTGSVSSSGSSVVSTGSTSSQTSTGGTSTGTTTSTGSSIGN